MAELTLDAAVAVLTSEVKGLRSDFAESRAETRSDMKMMAATYLPRSEFEQWRTATDRELANNKATTEAVRVESRTEVAKIRTETEARRVPWTAVGAFIVGAAGLALTIFQGV